MIAQRQKIVVALWFIMMCLVMTSASARPAWAASAEEIDAGVAVTLERFYSEIKDGRRIVQEAKGVLVFPNVYKAGFVFGGEYGEGALQINGKTVDYYNTATGSFGFQIGAQKKSIILLFMQDGVLNTPQAKRQLEGGSGCLSDAYHYRCRRVHRHGQIQ